MSMPAKGRSTGLGAFIVLVIVLLEVDADCNAYSGPSGSLECIPAIEGYDKPQYATCITKSYIETKSKGQHTCKDGTRYYCYYQCMLEVHYLEQGTVYPDCQCDPNAAITTGPSEVTTLDPKCLSPTGADCSWYRDCLEKKFPCADSTSDYAIAYAEKFCTLYNNRSSSFSERGQQWIDAVRKCLQVSLVPTLRPFGTLTCADIKERAFASHSGCYLKPYDRAPSVCDLPLLDFWQIFWTIKGAFRNQFSESLYGVFEVAKGCDSKLIQTVQTEMGKLIQTVQTEMGKLIQTVQTEMGKVVIKLTLPGSSIRNKRWVHDLSLEESLLVAADMAREKRSAEEFLPTDIAKMATSTHLSKAGGELHEKRRVVRQAPSSWDGESTTAMHYHQLANEAGEDMASQLGWSSKGVIWFAYGEYVGNGIMQVHILLADERVYVINTTRLSQPNMTAVVHQAAQAFEDGNITITLDGSRVRLNTLITCGDLDCQRMYLNVTAPPSSSATTTKVTEYWLMLTAGVTILVTRAANIFSA